MSHRKFDARKIGGDRVLAKCQVKLDKLDPFAHFESNVKSGHIVFNVRGGCLYLTEQISQHNLHKLFPDGNITVFTKLVLSGEDRPSETIHNLRIEFMRMRKNEYREGIVFKFVNISSSQMTSLERAVKNYPKIGDNEERAVPFDQLFTIDNKFELDDKH